MICSEDVPFKLGNILKCDGQLYPLSTTAKLLLYNYKTGSKIVRTDSTHSNNDVHIAHLCDLFSSLNHNGPLSGSMLQFVFVSLFVPFLVVVGNHWYVFLFLHVQVDLNN